MKSTLHPRTMQRVRDDNPGADEEMLDRLSHVSVYAFDSLREYLFDLIWPDGRTTKQNLLRWLKGYIVYVIAVGGYWVIYRVLVALGIGAAG